MSLASPETVNQDGRKQYTIVKKTITLVPTCFDSYMNHPQGAGRPVLGENHK
jgi:hypothetical protein